MPIDRLSGSALDHIATPDDTDFVPKPPVRRSTRQSVAARTGALSDEVQHASASNASRIRRVFSGTESGVEALHLNTQIMLESGVAELPLVFGFAMSAESRAVLVQGLSHATGPLAVKLGSHILTPAGLAHLGGYLAGHRFAYEGATYELSLRFSASGAVTRCKLEVPSVLQQQSGSLIHYQDASTFTGQKQALEVCVRDTRHVLAKYPYAHYAPYARPRISPTLPFERRRANLQLQFAYPVNNEVRDVFRHFNQFHIDDEEFKWAVPTTLRSAGEEQFWTHTGGSLDFGVSAMVADEHHASLIDRADAGPDTDAYEASPEEKHNHYEASLRFNHKGQITTLDINKVSAPQLIEARTLILIPANGLAGHALSATETEDSATARYLAFSEMTGRLDIDILAFKADIATDFRKLSHMWEHDQAIPPPAAHYVYPSLKTARQDNFKTRDYQRLMRSDRSAQRINEADLKQVMFDNHILFKQYEAGMHRLLNDGSVSEYTKKRERTAVFEFLTTMSNREAVTLYQQSSADFDQLIRNYSEHRVLKEQDEKTLQRFKTLTGLYPEPTQ